MARMLRLRESPASGAVSFMLDGAPALARDGDTVLTAVLCTRDFLRRSELTGAGRAGFCLMGACQDCWVEANGRRVRACTTPVVADMRVDTRFDPEEGATP